MSEAKCPMCGGDLIQSEEFPYFYSCQSTNWWKSDADKLCKLDDCAASVPVWETLRRTRKALEIAVDALKRAHNTYCVEEEETTIDLTESAAHKWQRTAYQMEMPISIALEQITALEQKDK